MPRLAVTSYRTPGRLVPPRAERLRARSIVLAPGGVMPWHSTGRREELLLIIAGRLSLHIRRDRRIRSRQLHAGHAAFLPRATPHQLVNHAGTIARYVYITG